ADKLVALDIKAIWNFASFDFRAPRGIVVEDVHLSDSLMMLSYSLNNNV
ncbi:MAG: redox-sensing transcriptional repressor Rex, partial [Defluviitaleaceae bacterium]|nr:redox-sensing transcriptional repressor Rex [Defluviitaleaceae bacterium]